MEINDNHSFQIANDIIETNISDLKFPFLISFPRTGSHWLRMIMELYFEKPSLVRAFYYKNATSFTCYHRHDEELEIVRENVIYLYRKPVDTIYSQMNYHKEDLENVDRVKHWAVAYGKHLKKWLIEEAFTEKKTILTYEGLRDDIVAEFMQVCDHFNERFLFEKLTQSVRRVTKSEVKRRTVHDPQVINSSEDYASRKQVFIDKNEILISRIIISLESKLEKYI